MRILSQNTLKEFGKFIEIILKITKLLKDVIVNI